MWNDGEDGSDPTSGFIQKLFGKRRASFITHWEHYNTYNTHMTDMWRARHMLTTFQFVLRKKCQVGKLDWQSGKKNRDDATFWKIPDGPLFFRNPQFCPSSRFLPSKGPNRHVTSPARNTDGFLCGGPLSSSSNPLFCHFLSSEDPYFANMDQYLVHIGKKVGPRAQKVVPSWSGAGFQEISGLTHFFLTKCYKSPLWTVCQADPRRDPFL